MVGQPLPDRYGQSREGHPADGDLSRSPPRTVLVTPPRAHAALAPLSLSLPLYEELFRRSHDAMALLASDGSYLLQNQAHLLLFGYADTQLVGHTPALHMSEDRFARTLVEARANGLYRGDVRCTTRSGRSIMVDITVYAIEPSVGHARRWVWIGRDVTSTRRVEEALLISRQVVEATPAPILVVGSDARCRWVSPAFKARFCVMDGDVIGRLLSDVAGLESLALALRTPLARCLAGDEQTHQGWIHGPHHRQQFLVATLTPLRAAAGAVEGVAVIISDQTALKDAAEAEGRRAERLLQQQTVLFALAKDEAIQNGYLGEAVRAVTEQGARTLDVAHAALWMFTEDGARLELIDRYERDVDRHTTGRQIDTDAHVSWLGALGATEVALESADVANDPRVASLAGSEVCRAGASIQAPIRVHGQLVGVLVFEQLDHARPCPVEDKTFAGSLATLMTVVLEARQWRQSEARFRQLVDGAPIGMCLYDSSGAVLRVNRAFAALLGYDEAELRGCRTELFVHPDDAGLHSRLLVPDAGSRLCDASPVDVRYVTRAGEVLCLSLTARRMSFPESAALVTVAIVQDVTAQRKAEALLRQANEDLETRVSQSTAELLETNARLQAHVCEVERAERAARASEERFRQLAQYVRDVFWLADVQTHQILYVGPAYERIWGRSCESLYAAPDEWGKAIHPQDRARVRKAALSQRSGAYDEKYRIVRPDGGVRWIRERAFPIVGEDGTVTRMAGMAEDITDYQHLEQQVRQAAKMESLGRLAGGVAHDFNNLLTVIRGYCSFLVQALPEESAQHKQIVEIQNAADRGANLSQQLLLFSRGQAVQPKVVDLNGIIQRMTDMLHRVVGEDVHLQLQLSSNLWAVRLDPGQFEQVIVNLVVNARDALSDGGRISIETHNRVCTENPAGRCVCVVVRDTGCGMDEAVKAQMFEPFFTTKKTGKGTGLGLATVHGIVTKSEGRLLVESAPGQGTSITVEFPAHEGAVPLEREVAATQGLSGSETILLVEDAATVRQLLREVLRSAGYRIVEAADGVEALQQVVEHDGPIHLVITDLVMPRMNGRQLMEQVRPLRPDTLFLFMSGYMSDKVGRQGLEAPFLQKPFLPSDLLRAVRKVLHRTSDLSAGHPSA